MKLARVSARPAPADWPDDAEMLIEEYIAVFYPDGPLTASSLRTEIRKGTLTPSPVAGKFYITPAKVRAMFKAAECLAKRKAPAFTSVKGGSSPAPENVANQSGSLGMDRLRSAQVALASSLTRLGGPSPTTSPANGRRRSAKVAILATQRTS